MSTKTYLFHELSSIFPLMEGEEFDELVGDLKEKGQLEEGILFEGKILDGRNRYRACKLLNIPFKAQEFSKKMSARDYIISTNLYRRHLNKAQRSEIGLILLEEEEKKAQERQIEIAKLKAESTIKEGKKGFQKNQLENINLESLIDSKKFGEMGSSTVKVASKVKVGTTTLSKAKKIKEVAKKEPIIEKEWEKAKKGESSVDAVYKKAKIIEKLPEDVKKEVEKKNPKITFKQAETIATKFQKPEQREKILKEIDKSKKQSEKIIETYEDMAKVEDKIILAKIDIDQDQIKIMTDIWLKISQEYRCENLIQYTESTKKKCLEIMQKAGKFILNEVDKCGKKYLNR